MTVVSWGGVSHTIPDNRAPKGWGQGASAFLLDLAAKAIPTTGGLQTLTGELNFGATFGIVGPYFKSSSSNISATGVIRLANNEGLGFRNAANNADLIFKVNASNALEFNGSVIQTAGSKLSDFAATTSAELRGVITDETGTGSLVFAQSPTLVTPVLGVASATSINKLAITAPATGSTLTIADGKTLTVNNTLTFAGTDAASVAFGAGGTVAYTSDKLSAFAATTSAELASKISDETGTGSLVFATGPTLVTPKIEDAADFEEQGSAPSNPSSGRRKIYPDSNGDWYSLDSGGIATRLGSGSGSGGGINYITNPDAESGTTGWSTYADAAAATPADGTGGSPTVTWTRNTTTPLRGNADFKYTKPASNVQGQGISFPFTISAVDKSFPHLISFDFNTSATNYTAGDLVIYIYDVTNAALITPTTTSLPKGTSKITVQFAATTSTSYRLILHQAGTSALAYDLYFDNFKVSTDPIIVGAAIEDDQDYANPTTQGFGTISSSSLKYKRVGPNLHVWGRFTTGTVAASLAYIQLPSGLTVGDTGSGNPRQVVGSWWTNRLTATVPKRGAIGAVSGDAYVTFALDEYTGSDSPYATLNGNQLTANSTVIGVNFIVPIARYAGNGTVILGAGATTTFYADDGTSDVFGVNGALVPNVAFGAGSTNRDITISSQQAIRGYTVEINYRGFGWCKASDIFPYFTGHNNNAGNTVGVQGVWTSATNFRVSFGNRGTAVSASGVDNGASAWATEFAGGTRFRLVEASPGTVGVGPANSTDSGIIRPRKGQTALTFSSTPAGWSLIRANGLYYQDQDGNHRLKFEICATITSTSSSTATIIGVTFKNTSGFNQPARAMTSVTTAYNCYTGVNNGSVSLDTASAQTNFKVSGDVELESKPSWA